MPDHFVTLGAFDFTAQQIELGPLPRSVTVASNALSSEPIQVNAFVSGFMPVAIYGFLEGMDTQDETAVEHLLRLRHNLKTEVAKDSNSLTILWDGVGAPETYRVFKNNDFGLVIPQHVQATCFLEFSLTLNCLP
jgi:hypothetical protein